MMAETESRCPHPRSASIGWTLLTRCLRRDTRPNLPCRRPCRSGVECVATAGFRNCRAAPTDRRQFLNWAMENRIAPSGLKIPRHRRGSSRKPSAADQDAALSVVVDGESLSTRDRTERAARCAVARTLAPSRARPDRGSLDSNWVFRGHSPGQHINAMSLRDRLRHHPFNTRAAS